MDKHRDTRSYDRRDQDPRGRRGGATRRKRKKHGRAFKVVMTIVLIFVITLAMLLCMSAAYIKNVIIPDASLDMSDFNPNLTSKVLAQNPETGPMKRSRPYTARKTACGSPRMRSPSI